MLYLDTPSGSLSTTTGRFEWGELSHTGKWVLLSDNAYAKTQMPKYKAPRLEPMILDALLS